MAIIATDRLWGIEGRINQPAEAGTDLKKSPLLCGLFSGSI